MKAFLLIIGIIIIAACILFTAFAVMNLNGLNLSDSGKTAILFVVGSVLSAAAVMCFSSADTEKNRLSFHKTTEEEKYIISKWKYKGEYSIYNSIPYEKQIETHCGFADPENNFYSFVEASYLIGYINLKENDNEVLFGIGLNPDFCNMGYGQKISKKACEISHKLYPDKPVCLEVRTWNKRAVKCYEKAGFRIVGEPIKKETPAGEGLFYFMTED